MPSINKKYKQNPGNLVHKIDIKRKNGAKPINGIVQENWEIIYSPRCSVSNNTGKEYLREDIELYGRESKKFTFRTHPKLEIKQKDIIIYNNEKWEITSVYDYDDNKQFTVAVAIKCEQ